METATEQHRPSRVSPDIFTTPEAAAFLKLPNARAFRRRCKEFGVSGVKCGHDWTFAREQLEYMRRRMYGLDPE